MDKFKHGWLKVFDQNPNNLTHSPAKEPHFLTNTVQGTHPDTYHPHTIKVTFRLMN